MHPSMYDLLLLNLVHRATDWRLRSGGFCGEVKVVDKFWQGEAPRVERDLQVDILRGIGGQSQVSDYGFRQNP